MPFVICRLVVVLQIIKKTLHYEKKKLNYLTLNKKSVRNLQAHEVSEKGKHCPLSINCSILVYLSIARSCISCGCADGYATVTVP
jgi:hypothetical protein